MKRLFFVIAVTFIAAITVPAMAQVEAGRDITKYRISEITPGSESVTLVPNGGVESRGLENPASSGRYPAPPLWTQGWGGFSVEPAPPGVSTPDFLGIYHWLVHAEDLSQAGAAVSYLTLQPNTDYVLSAYVWNWGDSGHRVQAVIDAYEVNPETCLAKAQCYWDLAAAGEGYFIHVTFTTGNTTAYFARCQFWREAGDDTGWPMQPYACMYDNLAVTRLSDFLPPQPPGVKPLTPKSMSYQGKLTNPSGQAVADGAYDMQFGFYDASTAGAQLWESPIIPVAVSGGLFTAQIDNIPIMTAFPHGEVWMQIKVGTETLAPRIKINATPYAFRAASEGY